MSRMVRSEKSLRIKFIKEYADKIGSSDKRISVLLETQESNPSIMGRSILVAFEFYKLGYKLGLKR